MYMVQVITVPRPSIWMLSRKPCVSALQAGAQVARLALVRVICALVSFFFFAAFFLGAASFLAAAFVG